MSDIELRAVTPEEMVKEIEEYVQRSSENKYAYQVGLKDVDFDIDEDRLEVLGLTLPFTSIDQAEDALSNARRLITDNAILCQAQQCSWSGDSSNCLRT